MSLIKSDVIREAAEAAGVKQLREDVATSLAADAEYRLREIVQDALNFKRHSRRRKLTAADINNALRVRNVEPLYGLSSSESIVYANKTTADGTSVAVVEDRELEFDDILSAPLPKAPLEVTFRAHWLAIEGVQPLIPENPLPEGMDVASAGKKRKTTEGGEASSGKDPMVQDVLSQELQLYYEKVTTAVLQGSPHILSAALDSLRSDPGLQALLPYFTQFITDEVKHSLKDLGVLNALVSMTAALLANPQLHVEPHLHKLMPAVMTCMVGKRLCKSALDPHWHLRERAAGLLTLIVHRHAASYSTLQSRITSTLLHAFLDPARPLTTHYGAVVGLSALGPQTLNQLILPNVAAYAQLLELDGVVSARGKEGALVIGKLTAADGGEAMEVEAAKDGEDGEEGGGAGLVLDRTGATGAEKWREQAPMKRYEGVKVKGALLHAAGRCLRHHPVVLSTPVVLQTAPGPGGEGEGGAGQAEGGAGPGEGGEGQQQQQQRLQRGGERYEEVAEVFGDQLLPYSLSACQGLCWHAL